LARFVQSSRVGVLHAGIAAMVALDVFEHLVPDTGSATAGNSASAARGGAGRSRDAPRSLAQRRGTAAPQLQEGAFLGGGQPLHDDPLFGAFRWARTVSRSSC
jgi:hypothetical protein